MQIKLSSFVISAINMFNAVHVHRRRYGLEYHVPL